MLFYGLMSILECEVRVFSTCCLFSVWIMGALVIRVSYINTPLYHMSDVNCLIHPE